MELRWFRELKSYDGHGNYLEPVLQYRVLETVIGSAMCATDTSHKWSKWRDVPTVYEDE